MFAYGKTASNAIAAMSYLAERYDGGRTKASSGDIAAERGISKALVAKLLTTLSQAGLVAGAPGPRGGYYLACEPGEINLLQIVALFEKVHSDSRCPFGTGWCGEKEPCPLHDQLVDLRERTMRFLTETTLEVFVAAPEPAPAPAGLQETL